MRILLVNPPHPLDGSGSLIDAGDDVEFLNADFGSGA
jgi:hypothetical protein